VLQAGIETFDSLIRIGTNTMSFARLAAFGLTHAALCGLIWSATTALEHRGLLGVIAGVAVFLVGNTVAFALEGLVAGIQALRLEYYELFSRILVNEGHQFCPWHVPILSTKES
jgi:V/A-type H+-transporting ATPase subunit I